MAPKVFSLRGKGLILDDAADIEPHVKPLLDDTTFTEVHLGGNTFGQKASKRLAEILKTQKNLQIAELSDIFTSRLLGDVPAALSELLKVLKKIPTLHTINLSDNALGFNLRAVLTDYLEEATSLRHLILDNNGLGPVTGKAIGEALTVLAEKKEEARKKGEEVPLLESIVCGRNRLENGSMAAWATAFKAHAKGIRSVKMIQNGIRPEGISLLLKEGLSYATMLEVLDLQDNIFTLPGSTALAGVVQKWPSLRELGVGDCLLSARGGIKVAQALAAGKNEKLQTLRLQFNDINAKGVKQFLFAAQNTLPALRRIELNGNKFMEDDSNVEELRVLLEKRQEEHGTDEDAEDSWGIDELEELEEDEEDEEDEEEEEKEEASHLADKTLKETVRAEDEPVTQKKDADVDALADVLEKTGI